MKKNFLFVLMLSAIGAAAFGQSGTIRELSGEVELRPSGAQAFTAARAGDTVAPDTIISTGFRSTAVIAIGSSTITVRPITRLSLAEIQSAAGSESLNLNLQTGRVRVDVSPPAGTRASAVLQSPSATASVRGTSFEFDTVSLTVFEGRVAFTGASTGPATMLRGGDSSYIGAEGQPVSPGAIREAGFLPAPPVGSEAVKLIGGEPESGDITVEAEYD